MAAIDAGTYKDPKRGMISLAAWREIWLKGRRVEETTTARDDSHWRKHLAPRWGGKPVRSIRHQDVQNWVVELEESGLARNTVSTILSSLGVLLDAAKRDQRIELNPCTDVVVRTPKGAPVKSQKPPTGEQIAAACSKIRPRGTRRHPLDIYSRIPRVIEETGMRWGEVIGVLPDALDLEAGDVHVRRVVEQVGSSRRLREYPKSDAGYRTIPLTRRARALFEEHLEAQEPDEGKPIFRTLQGTLLNRSNFHDRVWLPATVAAGIHTEYVRPSGRKEHWPSLHDIRHTFASRLEWAGVPESIRKEVIGHERPKSRDVTWNYTHAPREYRRLILAALEGEPDEVAAALARPLRLVS